MNLPRDWESERTVLGGVLTDPTLYKDLVAVGTLPTDFDKPAHRALWLLMGRLEWCDLPSVCSILEQSKAYSVECGGIAYVCALPFACPSIMGIPIRAQSLSQTRVRREVAILCTDFQARTADPFGAGGLVGDLQAAITAIAPISGRAALSPEPVSQPEPKPVHPGWYGRVEHVGQMA